MNAHGLPQIAQGDFLQIWRLCAGQRLVGFEGELGVDDDGARRVWQMHKAVRSFAVRQGVLQGIAVGRQRL